MPVGQGGERSGDDETPGAGAAGGVGPPAGPRTGVAQSAVDQEAVFAAFWAGAFLAGAFFAVVFWLLLSVAFLVAGALAALRAAGFTAVTARTPSLRSAATNFSPRTWSSAYVAFRSSSASLSRASNFAGKSLASFCSGSGPR